ncbi:MAG: TTAGGG repeat binding factor [Phylliscum demangeonii]|nr:MAG: TTAGGG repeat binding factor [Phylliscum demangeonii]
MAKRRSRTLAASDELPAKRPQPDPEQHRQRRGTVSMDVDDGDAVIALPEAAEPTNALAGPEEGAQQASARTHSPLHLSNAPAESGGETSPGDGLIMSSESFQAQNRLETLGAAEMLAVHILGAIVLGPVSDTLSILRRDDALSFSAYMSMTTLFRFCKRMFGDQPFLTALDGDLVAPDHRHAIRKLNLATWFLAVVGLEPTANLVMLHDHFIDTFALERGRLLKASAALYLELKTQLFIQLRRATDRSNEELLGHIFPINLGSLLLAGRPDGCRLLRREEMLIEQAGRRCELLYTRAQAPGAAVSLAAMFPWEDFLHRVLAYGRQHWHELVMPPDVKLGKPARASRASRRLPRPRARRQRAPAAAGSMVDGSDDVELSFSPEAFTSHDADGANPSTAPRSVEIGPAEGEPSEGPDIGGETMHSSARPAPTSTQALYEAARMAAAANASPSARRTTSMGQRRAWTDEEEQTLLIALDKVNGPHWSQILELYGAGGSVSEALKDRNQVQLKDKARNIKLFFLKAEGRVPPCLQAVTGDLRTRAPNLAARHDLDRRARRPGPANPVVDKGPPSDEPATGPM